MDREDQNPLQRVADRTFQERTSGRDRVRPSGSVPPWKGRDVELSGAQKRAAIRRGHSASACCRDEEEGQEPAPRGGREGRRPPPFRLPGAPAAAEAKA